MPEDVRVEITDATVISALNTPGGLVFQWRNDTERAVLERCYATSPVNDVANAAHRGGMVGEFKASWVTRRRGGRHRVGFEIENFSDHAIYVEEGRGPSSKRQTFSWTEWGGDTRTVSGTRGREGQHILRNAVNRVLSSATGGAYTPLT